MKSVVLVVLLCVLGGGAAHGANLTLNLVTTAPSACNVLGTVIQLFTNWSANGGAELMFDDLGLPPIQNVDWHCDSRVEASIFWKDLSLGICQGFADAASTAVGNCGPNGQCSPVNPGLLGDYTEHWNNIACSE